MTAHAHCVAPDNTLVEAAGLMRQLDVGAIPVLEIDRLTGMVTDRDIAVRAVADGRDPNTTLVRDVMSQGIVSIFADQSVEEAVRVMEQKQVRRLPVLSREMRLVGIVALGDIAVSSNPAFGGMALREVSESQQTMSHRGSRAATPGQRLSTPLDEKSGKDNGQRNPTLSSPRARSTGKRAKKSTVSRAGASATRKPKRKSPVGKKRGSQTRKSSARRGK